MSLFICHKVSRDFVGWLPSSLIIGPLELEIMEFVVSIPISISISIPMPRFTNVPTEMFYKKAVLTNFLRKTSVLEFFNKVAGLNTSCEYFKIFKNTYFEEHLWTAASVYFIINFFLSQNSFFITVWKRSQKLLFVLFVLFFFFYISSCANLLATCENVS